MFYLEPDMFFAGDDVSGSDRSFSLGGNAFSREQEQRQRILIVDDHRLIDHSVPSSYGWRTGPC